MRKQNARGAFQLRVRRFPRANDNRSARIPVLALSRLGKPREREGESARDAQCITRATSFTFGYPTILLAIQASRVARGARKKGENRPQNGSRGLGVCS